MRSISAYGISVEVPPGWDARLFRHEGGEPTLHLASFPLPASDGEFGSRATGRMRAGSIFVALTEYRIGTGVEAGRGMFAGALPGSLSPSGFSERTLLRPRPGQRGLQRFFSAGGRAFCLYAVLSAGEGSDELVAAADAALGSLHVAALERP
jgi:hypothetical protein